MSLEMMPLSRELTLDNLQRSYQSLVERQSELTKAKTPSLTKIWRRRLVPNFCSTLVDLNSDTRAFFSSSTALLKTTSADSSVLAAFEGLTRLLDAHYLKSLRIKWWERGFECKQKKEMEVLVKAVGDQIGCLQLLIESGDPDVSDIKPESDKNNIAIVAVTPNVGDAAGLLDDIVPSSDASSALNLVNMQEIYQILITKHSELAKVKRGRFASWFHRKNFRNALAQDQFAACSFVWDTVKVVKDSCDLGKSANKRILRKMEVMAHKLDSHYNNGLAIKWWQTGYDQLHQKATVKLLNKFGSMIPAIVCMPEAPPAQKEVKRSSVADVVMMMEPTIFSSEEWDSAN